MIEFREDGMAVMTKGGLAQRESITWTLDTSRAPRWLDLKVSERPGEPGRFVPGLLEWAGTDGAAIQFFTPGGSHPTQFQDMFTSKKQFMRRLPAAPALAPAGERVVYRAPAWTWSGGETDAVFDPEDGESVVRVVENDITGARQVAWRTPSGSKCAVGGAAILAPGVTLSPAGFLNRRPVIEANPSYLLKTPSPEVKDLRKFISIRPDGSRGALSTVIPNDANTRIVRARLVRTKNGDPATQGPTGLYEYTARGFDGEKTLLRAIPYTTTGGDEKLDGPALGVALGRVAYFDQASRKLVMVDGEVRDIAQGKAVDHIKGVDLMWYVDSPGAFYTLDAKESPARPWGVADDKSGAVVAGGRLGIELVLSRVEIDAHWNARKVEAARAVVPAQGSVSAERTARNVAAAHIAAESGKPACPLLVFDPGLDTQGSDW